ncbi:hypothetical protein DCE94_10555 [Agromyces badenianii]|nr:hypothetical protein DCE94_10555 [Agromyces badenianii]
MFATVGFREKPIRPIPIDDLTDILVAAVDGRMPRETVAVVGSLLNDPGRPAAQETSTANSGPEDGDRPPSSLLLRDVKPRSCPTENEVLVRMI